MSTQQFIRKASLLVLKPDTTTGENFDSRLTRVLPSALDLSQMQFQFSTKNADEEGPTNCHVRVFNLSQTTVDALIKYNYSKLVLQAGYEGSYGVIFQGDIKQFRVGRLNSKDSFLDILAADGDLGYNYAVINTTLSAGQNSLAGKLKAIDESFKSYGITIGDNLAETGGVLPRGKVMFGMARTMMREAAETAGCTWSIQDGKIQIIPLDGYLPGEAVKLTSATGLIGVPEQTQLGIQCQCLLNPKIKIGGRIQIDNASIKQTLSQTPTPGFQLAYNQWSSVQNFANVSRDGFYRVYVAEHEGDTRGQEWYTNIIALAVDDSSKKVKPYG